MILSEGDKFRQIFSHASETEEREGAVGVRVGVGGWGRGSV